MDTERIFLGKLSMAGSYPDSLIRQDESRSSIRKCREHYEANKSKIFDRTSSRIEAPLVIIDFDADHFEQDDLRKAKVHIIRNMAGLRRKLSWPTPSEAEKWPGLLVRDPGLRVVLLERFSPSSLMLNLSEEMLLELLTYHQVPSYVLNFLTSGGHSWEFANSTRFAGFRGGASAQPHQNSGVARLGRSGKHIRLCLTLFSIRQFPTHTLPHGVDPSNTSRWETHSAVVYLYFDVVEGTAVWLIASPRCYHPVKGNGKHNPFWDTVREHAGGTLEEVAFLDTPERLRISLNGLLAFAEWSMEEISPRLQDLEMRLSQLTEPYLHPFGEDDDEPRATVHEQDLREMAFLMEQRHESAINIDHNLRVIRCLLKFFVGEVSRSLTSLDNRHAEQMWTQIEDFGNKLSSVIAEMEDLVDRAQALDRLAANREEYVSRNETRDVRMRQVTKLINFIIEKIQRMQTHHANQQMESLAELTADDSSAMKQLSFIALILLPVTVVSTILSTDIVKFQDLSNDNEGSGADGTGGGSPEAPVPVYSFSAAAFGTWAVASVVMTLITLAIVKPMGGRRRSAGGDAGGKSPKSTRNFRFSLLKQQVSKPWKLRGISHSADEEEEQTIASEPSPAARSIHTAPMVSKTPTPTHSLETQVVGVVGVPVQAGASQTLLTSTGRWLEVAWMTLWRRGSRRSTTEKAKAAVTASGLPR